MLLEAIDLLRDLKFELGNYFEPLMLSVLHYMEMILDDRLLRRYINCPDDKPEQGRRGDTQELSAACQPQGRIRVGPGKIPPKPVAEGNRLFGEQGRFSKGASLFAGAFDNRLRRCEFPVPPYRFRYAYHGLFEGKHNGRERNPRTAGLVRCAHVFLEPDLWHEPYELDASESHHLTRVLRIREEAKRYVLDGRGREGRFRFALQEKRQGRGPAASRRVDVSRTGIEGHPCGGLDKTARRGWILEKAVEFEASRIWLWQAERSQFPCPRTSRSHGRPACRRSQQCRNPWLPELRTMPGGVDELHRVGRGAWL